MIKKIGLYIILFCSIALFLIAAFILYNEYDGYQERVKRYAKETPVDTKKTNASYFTAAEVNTLESYRTQRNNLLGYENFLMESATYYDPSNFSYANLLKEKLITQLDNMKFTQPYWDKILTNFYTDIYASNNTALLGYDAIMKIPNSYVNDDIEGIEDIEVIEKISTQEYWKRQVFEMDRSAQNIQNIWRQNKAYFYTFLSKSKYDKQCKNVITDLIAIHEAITQTPHYKEFYQTYDVKDSIFHTFPFPEYVQTFEYSWSFSFWDRRFTEENDEIVFEILEEIKNHYEN